MNESSWKDAIIEVLKAHIEPLHYTDITDEIIEKNLKTDVGATPAATVTATISLSLQKKSLHL